jgi:hypothetical protein
MIIKMTCQQFKRKCSLIILFVISYINVSKDTDWKEHRATAAGLGNVRVLAGYGEILKENRRFLSGHTSWLDFFRSTLGTVASPPVLLDTGGDDQYDLPTVQEKVLTP